MRTLTTRAGAALVAVLGAMPALTAQDDTANAAPAFHRDVLPILRQSCVACHREGKDKGSLILTDYESVMRGADGEAIVIASKPDDSLLIEVVSAHGDEPPSMPEEGAPLSAAQVDVLRQWVAAGAARDEPSAEFRAPDARAIAPDTYRTPPVLTDLAWGRASDGADNNTGDWLATPGRGEVLVHRRSGSEFHIAHRLPFDGARVEALAVSPDGTRLAACGGSQARFGQLTVWQLDGAEPVELFALRLTSDCLFGVSWSPDGKLLAVGGTDTAMRTFGADDGKAVLFNAAHDDWVLDTCWSIDGSHLVTVSRDRSMKLTKVETQQFIDNITSITPGALRGGLIAVDRHPLRDVLLVGGASGVPTIFRMHRTKARKIGDDFNRLHTLDAMPGRVFDLCYSPDGARAWAVCSSGDSGEVRAFQIPPPPDDKDDQGKDEQTEKPRTLWHHATESPVYGLALSPDASLLAIAGRSGMVYLHDATTGEPRGQFSAVPLAAVEADADRGTTHSAATADTDEVTGGDR